MSVFSENLIRLRKQLKLSQEELSKKCGVTQQAISMIEAEKRSPTEFTMKQISDGLGVSLSDLLIPYNEKKPTADSGDGLRDEIIDLLGQLNEEELPQIRDYVEWLKSRHAK